MSKLNSIRSTLQKYSQFCAVGTISAPYCKWNTSSKTWPLFFQQLEAETLNVLTKLKALGGDDEPLTLDSLKTKNLNKTNERFLTNLAFAENLIRAWSVLISLYVRCVVSEMINWTTLSTKVILL